MRRNPDYILKYICGTPYLLVTGKEAALLSKEIVLNPTAAEIWELLDEEMTLDELINKSCTYFECVDEEERKYVSNTVIEFSVQMMISKAFLEYPVTAFERELHQFTISKSTFTDQLEGKVAGKYVIGNIGVTIYGEKIYLPDNFDLFRNDFQNIKDFQKIVVKCCDGLDEQGGIGKRFLMADSYFLFDERMCLHMAQSGFVALFNKNQNVRWLFLSKDGKYAEIGMISGEINTIKNELYETTRFVFLYFAQRCGYVALHSASIIHNNKAILFSAMSGVGKSTHAAIWSKLFSSEVFNGDVNLLSLENGKSYIYGLPWCGTSEKYSIGKYEIGSIVMLKQAVSNEIVELTAQEKTTHILHRFISHNWFSEDLDILLMFAEKLIKQTDVFRLQCNMEDEAAIICRERVENNYK